jgi:hypothetical protein
MLITIILITMVMLIILQGDIVLVVSFFVFYTTLEDLIIVSLLYNIAQVG